MKKTLVLLIWSAWALFAQAQRADLVPFLVFLQPSNEVPAISDTSSATGIIWLHLIDDGKNIYSGSIDFDLNTKFSGAVTVTGLHIHSGAAGTSGPILIPTDISASNSVAVDSTGRTAIFKQVQFPQSTPALAASTLADLITNPQNYYVNIHTPDHPSGAMRGQLLPADMTAVMGLLSPKNEVPPTSVTGSAVGTVLLLRGRDAAGFVAAATAIFNLQYTGFEPNTTFTGFHIHNGTAGTNGPVIINTGISGASPVTVDSTGAGNLNYRVAMTPLDANFAGEVATVNGLFSTPNNHYINLHTTVNPGGAIRDQMRSTEQQSLLANLQPANETPPVTGLAASAQAEIPVVLIRNPDGSVAAGTVIFDVNYRGFPAGTTFTGLHIHQGTAGDAGSVTVSSGLGNNTSSVASDTGNGNIFRLITVADASGSRALNGIVQNPSNYYVNLHTTVNPSGAIRDQLGAPLGKPAIGGIGATASVVTSGAPGSILSIYGTNLAGYTSDLSGFYQAPALTTTMNGVTATIGGLNAPLYYVSPAQLNVQVPFEAPAGAQPVVVTTPAGASPSMTVTIAATAPSIFIVGPGSLGAVTKNTDFSLVTPANPVKAGDIILIFSTGLAQTTPPLQTGVRAVAPNGAFNNTGAVTATIGGVSANVIYSIASPGFAGLYQTAVTVPAGVPAGNASLVLSSGGALSNAVNLAVAQ